MNRSDQIRKIQNDLPNLFGADFDAALAKLGRLCAAANLASVKSRKNFRVVGGNR
jgi:hypothetical protein